MPFPKITAALEGGGSLSVSYEGLPERGPWANGRVSLLVSFSVQKEGCASRRIRVDIGKYQEVELEGVLNRLFDENIQDLCGEVGKRVGNLPPSVNEISLGRRF